MDVISSPAVSLLTADILQDLKLRIFTPKLSQVGDSDFLNCYVLWKNTWQYALKAEMGQKNGLYSDHFTRQQKIASLYYQDSCLGLFTSNSFNLDLMSDRDDTYFIDWPDEVLDQLAKNSPHIITLENFTLGRDRPSAIKDLCLKQLFGALAFKILSQGQASFMLSTPRRNKNIHLYTKLTGAHVIKADVPYKIEGQRVDLVMWKKGDASGFATDFYLNLAQQLLNKTSNEKYQGELYVA